MTDKDQVLKPVTEPEVTPTKVKSEKDETGDTSTDDFEEDNEKVTCDMECDCENFDMSLCENCHLGIAESENKLLEARKSSSVSTKNQNSEIGKDQEVPENQIPELQNSAQYAVEKGEHNEEQTSVTEPEVTPTKVKPYKFEIVGASTDYWAKDNDEGQKIS
nr:expressed protein [Hymenolepis microstoma]